MTLVDLTAAIFAASHIARFIAYWPQVIVLLRISDEARAVSVLSWALFGVSHFATAAYALVAMRDLAVFLAFAVNTVCCALIIGLTLYKRWRFAPARA